MNERIRADQVRTISEKGEQVGILPVKTALTMAREAGLDLVEVARNANPPVCRIMDYGKYKYEMKKKTVEARKKSHHIKLKELRLRPKTEEHDLMTKMQHAREFLMQHHKVLVNMLFRGREMAHMNLGKDLILRFVKELEDISKVEQEPRLEGRRMTLVLSPK
ncbi:MAG: translation initiation factor IF-3 [Planctomycetes bacterium]|nr:translation initiation factor IF-3 [Planctomycetota bacterium]